MAIRARDPLPLMLQLYDGNETRKVECVVRNEDGSELARLTLPHIAHGFYASTEVRMPEEVGFVTAQYAVLDSDEYEMSSETFIRDRVEESASKVIVARDEERNAAQREFLTGRVIEESSGDFIEGRVHAY